MPRAGDASPATVLRLDGPGREALDDGRSAPDSRRASSLPRGAYATSQRRGFSSEPSCLPLSIIEKTTHELKPIAS